VPGAAAREPRASTLKTRRSWTSLENPGEFEPLTRRARMRAHTRAHASAGSVYKPAKSQQRIAWTPPVTVPRLTPATALPFLQAVFLYPDAQSIGSPGDS
jgi:hypothetical protein